MAQRIPPSKRLKQEIGELLNGGLESQTHPLDHLLKLASTYLLRKAWDMGVLTPLHFYRKKGT